MSYGIPIDTLPFTDGAECKVKPHLQWLQTRRKQEQTALPPGVPRVVIPGRFDVLFGRGKPMQEHHGNLVRSEELENYLRHDDPSGNRPLTDLFVQLLPHYQRYHTILESFHSSYDTAKKFEKMQIADSVVQSVKAYEGRFLKQEGAGWEVVDDLTARNKVSYAFRTRRNATTSSGGSSAGKASEKRVEKPSTTPGTPLTPAVIEEERIDGSAGGKRTKRHHSDATPAPVATALQGVF
jgi:hypothetical protein